MKMMTKLALIIIGFALSTGVWAADAQQGQQSSGQQSSQQNNGNDIKAANLEQLLKMVKEGRIENEEISKERIKRFLANKAKQQQAVEEAKQMQKDEEAKSSKLESQFDQNEQKIASLQALLSKRLGSLRELFGVLQQVSGDTQGVFDNSIISAQFPGRGKWLGQFAKSMGRSTKLATIGEMEKLWYDLQQQMTESGKVTKFTTTVVKLNGQEVKQPVIRVGTFNLVSGDKYVAYDSDSGKVKELPRQPAGKFVSTAEALENAKPGSGFVPFGLDPTSGQLLALQEEVPTLEQRTNQGGPVGYVIIVIGIIAVLLAIERIISLTVMSARVRRQVSAATPDSGNPLGRVLNVYEENKDVDSETLQLKLDEAILKEEPKINTRLSFIKIISMVAPLLGLLGTVVGMITTFQAITLFGTGDPKTMAGGISVALVTTVLGLVVAIPTVLLHAIANGRAESIMHILTEQSAGLIAEHAEAEHKGR